MRCLDPLHPLAMKCFEDIDSWWTKTALQSLPATTAPSVAQVLAFLDVRHGDNAIVRRLSDFLNTPKLPTDNGS